MQQMPVLLLGFRYSLEHCWCYFPVDWERETGQFLYGYINIATYIEITTIMGMSNI